MTIALYYDIDNAIMNLQEEITLTFPEGKVTLPLVNFLRLTVVYLTQLLPDFYAETKSDSLKDFWKWLGPKLGLEEGKSVLL